MKFTKSILAASALAAMTLTACSDNDSENYQDYLSTLEVSSSVSSEYYNEDGRWVNVYETSDDYKYISDGYIYYSHSATYWADWNYYSWNGFCPSIATETTDVSADDVTAHQWSSASGTGCNSTGYMLGYWNVMEDTESIPEDPSLKIVFPSGVNTTPSYVYINNSNYGYWAMKNGTYYNAAFDNNSWFKATFYGVKDNAVTASVDAYLAQNGEIVNAWKAVDLSSLGTVDYIYIQLSSSDTGAYGMNNPAYICLDNLSVRFTY